MKRSHGPAFRRERKALMECSLCRGTGQVAGVFHDLHCGICDGTGWLCPDSGQALPLDELVLQLNLRLRDALAEIARARNLAGGAQQQYQQNNRRGAGASNFTGD